jgi:pseudouridine-5'-phosphate glycosidase
MHMLNNQYLDLSNDVRDALQQGVPVVALESTIISHGMPYPQNVATARQVEKVVRAHGAVPATIAIINGRLKAGLAPQEIEALGQQGRAAVKVSRRDIPFVLASGKTGATTVASTMMIAAMAGIRVFATGGIGGVHRNAQQTFDISADLQELAQTSVAVVCAGAKSILDLPLTMEYLETHGVPVIGYQTDTLPAFFTRQSDCLVDYRMESAEEIANALHIKQALGLRGGAVIANPIPHAFAMPQDAIDLAVETALTEALHKGIKGKESTPFLLARVCEITGGDSLASNIELVLNNARLAAEIGVVLQRLR